MLVNLAGVGLVARPEVESREMVYEVSASTVTRQSLELIANVQLVA